jgi:type II secretory pathway component PulF
MSDPEQEQGEGSRSTKTKRFWIGVSLIILFLFSAANVFLLLFIVPKFEQIFADTLPGRPLPTVTEFIITGRIVIAIVTLGWPILGAILLRQRKSSAILWINIGIVWTFFQIGITTIALFIPMTMGGDIFGMPDSNHP